MISPTLMDAGRSQPLPDHRPHLALYLPDGMPPAGLAALAGAVSAAGWRVSRCERADAMAALAPDLVISAGTDQGKLTGHPWLAWVGDDPALLRHNRRRLECLLSHDGWLVETAAQARFIRDSLTPIGRTPHIWAPADQPGEDVAARLADLAAQVRNAAGFTPAASGPGSDIIVRVGGRPITFIRRCLESLAQQTAPGVGVILVRYAPVPGLDALMEQYQGRLRRLHLVDVPGPTTRSACLWAGLAAVKADLFGMLDDDDALHPNHIASLTPLAITGGVAVAGAVQVSEDRDRPTLPATPEIAEERRFHALPGADRAALFNWRMAVHSACFLAPSPLLAAVGDDPGLDFAEDSYLIRRLARVAPLLPSWRVTADFYWRRGGGDNTAFSRDGRAEAEQRIADRERLDPVINGFRQGSTTADDLPLSPAWGQPADGPQLPALKTAADFWALPAGCPLYIYGSGYGGQVVVAELAKMPHLSITALLDSTRQGNAFDRPLLRPGDLPPNHFQTGLFIIASEYVTAMTQTLRGLGGLDIRDATPFIRTYTDLRKT
jgi:hypothetical protein